MTTSLRLFLLISAWLAASPASAGSFHFATAVFPPLVTVEADGSLVGPAIDILKGLAHRLGQSDELTVLPLNRLVETASKKPDYVISVSRTRERQDKLRWVKCGGQNDIILVSRADHPFPALADLKADSVVGVMTGTSMEELARQLALPGALHISSSELGLELLEKGRLDGWLTFRATADHLIRKTGGDVSQFTISSSLETIQFCIAMSPSASDADVDTVRRAAEGLVKEEPARTLDWKNGDSATFASTGQKAE